MNDRNQSRSLSVSGKNEFSSLPSSRMGMGTRDSSRLSASASSVTKNRYPGNSSRLTRRHSPRIFHMTSYSGMKQSSMTEGGTKRRHISSVDDSRPACTCATYHMPAPFPRTRRTAPPKEKRMNSCAPPPPSGNGRSCRAGCASIHPLVDRRNALCDDFAFSRYVTSLSAPVLVAQIQQSRRKKKATRAFPSLNDHAMLYIVRCYIHNIHDTLRRCETYFK